MLPLSRTLCASICLVYLMSAGVASAVLIENVTDGTVIFNDDGFEDDVATSNPNAPSTGSWTIGEPAAGFTVDVTDAVLPGPFEGVNYVQIARTASGNNATATANFALQDAGDTLRFTFALKHESGGYFVSLGGGSGDMSRLLVSPSTNANYQATRTTANDPKTSSFAVSTTDWQVVVLEHVLGSGEISLSVDGGISEVLPLTVSGGPISYLRFSTNGIGTTFNVDAVPEPASAMLLGGSMLVLMFCRRRM